MNAITSEYGAAAQPWHSDGIPDRSPLNYARTFAPAHVMLMQLQDTTVEMGATEVCPGTHFCMDGEFDVICEQNAFPVPTSAGDAILMNTNAWHRGAAYTDSFAKEHRVMLVLTFTPQPLLRAETRQMTQGLSYSIKSYQLGHTFNDMAKANQAGSISIQPLSFLRSIGWYQGRKSRHHSPAFFSGGDQDYGITHVTLSLMRCVADTDVTDYQLALGKFLDTGGFWWLPKFLQGFGSKEDLSAMNNSWYEFYSKTTVRSMLFIRTTFIAMCFSYHGFVLLSSYFYSRHMKYPAFVATRSLVFYLCAAALYVNWNRQIDEWPWAKDIVNHHRYVVHFPSEPREYVGPTALPNPTDILIETRLGSKHLGMYNDFVNYHPGNQYWRILVTGFCPYVKKYKMLPPVFQNAVAWHVVDLIDWETYGRFLYQDVETGNWRKLSTEDAVEYTFRALATGFDTALNILEKEIRFFLAECQYGHLRDTAMCRKYIPASLSSFRLDLLFQSHDVTNEGSFSKEENHRTISQRWKVARNLLIDPPRLAYHGIRKRHQGELPGFQLEPPEIEDDPFRFVEGDLVEALEGSEEAWFPAVIQNITAQGHYFVHFFDGEYSVNSVWTVRAFVPYTMGGGPIQAYRDDTDRWEYCTVLAHHMERDTYTIRTRGGQIFLDVDQNSLRRPVAYYE